MMTTSVLPRSGFAPEPLGSNLELRDHSGAYSRGIGYAGDEASEKSRGQ